MPSSIQDPHSEMEAKAKIEMILPDPANRRLCLSMLADSIQFINSLGRDWWAVTNTYNYPDSIWLQAGHYAVFMLDKNQVWMALDKQLVESPLRTDLDFRSSLTQGWTPQVGGLDQYQDRFRTGKKFSINGYYKPQTLEQHAQVWPKIKRLHFEFLYKASVVGQSMRSDAKALHLPGVLKYLRNEFERHLPDPLY
jgi:hypothetical protein